MEASELLYQNIKEHLAKYEDKGRGESPAFLNWFLENIFRLDPIDADDAICDRPNDKGIDGLYIDHTQGEIIVLQCKLKQKDSTIGDSPLKALVGTLSQLKDEDSVKKVLEGGANHELKNILIRENVGGLVSKGYNVVGIYVSNEVIDSNGSEFLNHHSNIRIYDRKKIASEYIDIQKEGGIEGVFRFDTSYVEPMVLQTGGQATTYILAVRATELVQMNGIDDGTLFHQNVRQSLGNTKVNKALRASVRDQKEHKNFALYHNGVNILCATAKIENEHLVISDYVVVNGAQSITTFKDEAEHLTDDLRVIAKVIQLNDPDLSKKITINSNNQNAIKPRDLKSTNEIQLRLRAEFEKAENGKYDLEIKRGQTSKSNSTVISNEEAGRLLLAFDLMEPYSAHQVYKLFDEKYADIFARPAVTAYRIIFLFELMQVVLNASQKIDYRPLSKYGLTRFFLLSAISDIMEKDPIGREIKKNPKDLMLEGKMSKFLNIAEDILTSVIVDLNFEVVEAGEHFDYKGDLKSPNKVRELRSKLLRSYEKDVARKKASSISSAFNTG